MTTSTLVRVCAVDDLVPDRGAAALVPDDGRTEQVALFRLASGEVFVVQQLDPFSGAHVMARGLVGSRLCDGVEVPTVAAPIYKQVFDLRTGACLDTADTSPTHGDGILRCWPVTIADGDVLVAVPDSGGTP
ncbi:nitrite reductase (NAD(P)H) small subunit [Cellulomonas sp. HZM]|uniref:nitrite reductase (NAD(P)H) small subunit n=1 Tax=Cellulomonas sp. HZM TaxID=1454010 RepID=UPI00049373A8|nr:nitrite reductase (NAD(P)H) small subunit [Cellulomonas sp. HZM]